MNALSVLANHGHGQPVISGKRGRGHVSESSAAMLRTLSKRASMHEDPHLARLDTEPGPGIRLAHPRRSDMPPMTPTPDKHDKHLSNEEKDKRNFIQQFLDVIRPHLEFLLLDCNVKPALIALVLNVSENTIAQIGRHAEAKHKKETENAKLARLANEDLRAATEALHKELTTAYKIRREETLFEVLLFPGQLVRSKEHIVRLEKLMKGAKHSLFIAIDCYEGVSVILLVDHTQMYCKGSRVAKVMLDDDDDSKRRVHVYCDKVLSYMLHHKYVIIDGEVAAHGSVNFSYHAMSSGGVIAIHDDQRLISPLLKDFARVLDTDSFRSVTKSELLEKTQPCEQCQLIDRLSANERQPTDECIVVDPVECSDPEAVVKRYFAMMTANQQAGLLATIKQDAVCAPAPTDEQAVPPSVKRAAASKKQARRAKRATPLAPKKQ